MSRKFYRESMAFGLVSAGAAIRDAIETIDQSPHKIALVVDERRRLLGTITDGDVRRAILAGRGMEVPVTEIMYRTPIVGRAGRPLDDAERLARRRRVRKIPLLDEEDRVVGIHTVGPEASEEFSENIVVLMAGGFGTRLRPLTEHAPKPLLSVGEKPLLETIIEQIIIQGFRKFFIAVHYKGDMVESHFGNGEKWDAEFQYLRESEPLGTAGALSLLGERPSQPILVMNADLLTKIDLESLLDYHRESGAIATMGVRAYEFEIPYGVVSTNGHRISEIIEKPIQEIFVNAGIYVLEPAALDMLEPGKRLDMPELFSAMIASGLETAAFPIREYWIDVGRIEDFRRANDDYPREFP